MTELNRKLSCAGWEPITTSREDTLTEQTGREIDEHNAFGEERGCWRPLNG